MDKEDSLVLVAGSSVCRCVKQVEIFVTENDKDRAPVTCSREPDLCLKVLTVMAQARLC